MESPDAKNIGVAARDLGGHDFKGLDLKGSRSKRSLWLVHVVPSTEIPDYQEGVRNESHLLLKPR